MNTFNHQFAVAAPQDAVLAFHQDTRVLKRLTPPPLFVQLHEFEPLNEGSTAEFTLWIGPVPTRWRSVHRDIGPHGFTDRQASGPLKHWQHTHRFTPIEDGRTLVSEAIEYEHPQGLPGLLTRLLFNPLGLTLLFKYREVVTRWFLLPDRHRATVRRAAAGTLVASLLLLAWRRLPQGGAVGDQDEN